MLSRTATIGEVVRIGRPMATTQAFATWSCSPSLDPRYLFAVMKALRPEFDRLAQGSTHRTIYMPAIKQISVPLPPLREQRAIADYLERQMTRIDALINKNKMLIASLRDRRAAIIARATRVGISDQGRRAGRVAWLPEVADSWLELPLRRVGRLVAGAAFPEAYQGSVDGPIPYFKVGDFEGTGNESELRLAEHTVTPGIASMLGAPVIPKGAVIFPKIGAALLSNRRRLTAMPCCTDQNLMALILHTGDSRYYRYLLETLDLGRLRMPGPVPLLNERDAANIVVPVPPVGEQTLIADFLDRRIGTIDRANAKRARTVALLIERRQALITAAVTGQLDVSVAA
jgi:type I restriction enzyme S subunit